MDARGLYAERRFGVAGPREGHGGEHGLRAARETAQKADGLGPVGGLADEPALEPDECVGRDEHAAGPPRAAGRMLDTGIVHDGADGIGGVVELLRVHMENLEAQTRLAEEALAPRRGRPEDQRGRRRRGGRGWQDVQAALLPADADCAGRGQPLDERTQRVRRREAEGAGQGVEIGGMAGDQRGQRVGLSGAGGRPRRQRGGGVGEFRRGGEAARQFAEAFERHRGGGRVGRRPRQDVELDVVGREQAQPRGDAVGGLVGIVEPRQDEDLGDQHADIGATEQPVAVEDGLEVETRVRTGDLPEGGGVPGMQ